MPTLITKHKEKELAVGIRKLYADVSNALKLSQVEYDGSVDYSSVFNPNNTSYETAIAFSKYFNGSKVCQKSSDNGCSQYYHKLKYSFRYEQGTGKGAESNLSNLPAIIFNNGSMLWILQSNNPDCFAEGIANKVDNQGNPLYNEDGTPQTYHYVSTYCGLIYFDVNGPKGPNRYGQDASRIRIDKTKVRPDAQPYEGQETLRNILSGIDKFVYEDYTVGE